MLFSRRQWLGALSAATAAHALIGLCAFLLQPSEEQPESIERSVAVSLTPLGDAPSAAMPAPEPAETPAPEAPTAASPAPAPAPVPAPQPESPEPSVAPETPPDTAESPAPDTPAPQPDVAQTETVAPETAGPVAEPEVVEAVTISPEDIRTEPQPSESVTARTPTETETETDEQAPPADTEAPRGTEAEAEPSGAGADETDEYIARVRSWLARNKDYPRRARRLGMEGVVRIRFAIDREGRVLEYRVVESSGHDLLDREVEAMIERAQPLPRIPESLRRNRMELIVPIRFTLR